MLAYNMLCTCLVRVQILLVHYSFESILLDGRFLPTAGLRLTTAGPRVMRTPCVMMMELYRSIDYFLSFNNSFDNFLSFNNSTMLLSWDHYRELDQTALNMLSCWRTKVARKLLNLSYIVFACTWDRVIWWPRRWSNSGVSNFHCSCQWKCMPTCIIFI